MSGSTAGVRRAKNTPRSTNPDRRRENLAALEVELTDEDVERLDELSERRERFFDPSFAPDWRD